MRSNRHMLLTDKPIESKRKTKRNNSQSKERPS